MIKNPIRHDNQWYREEMLCDNKTLDNVMKSQFSKEDFKPKAVIRISWLKKKHTPPIATQ
jgi:hypothetical protein